MTKKILMLMILCLLVAGCTAAGGRNQFKVAEYNKGTQGLTLEFLDNAPPGTVYEETQFPVTLRVANRGALDVPYALYEYEYYLKSALMVDRTLVSPLAKVDLTVDDFYLAEGVELTVENSFFEILGKSDIVPQGQEKIVRVATLEANPVTGQRHSPDTQVFVSVCYPYATKLVADVCMDFSSYQQNLRTQVCEARDLAFSGGQGAPVAVSKVEVQMLPYGEYLSPAFVIHVDNVGDGSVLRAFDAAAADQGELCSLKSDSLQDVNTIQVFAQLAGIELDCEPLPFRLISDQGRVFCKVSQASIINNPGLFALKDNFVTSLNVELFYVYTSGVSTDIEIERRFSNLIQGQNDKIGYGCLAHEELVDGKCVDRCTTQVGDGYSCSCTRSQCIDLGPGSCEIIGQDLCDPGRYCCK